MYEWYKSADTCYVYLCDMPDHDPLTYRLEELLEKCRWFGRGWTLQELLAPKQLEFYNSSWMSIGTRLSLSAEISVITGIDEDILKCLRAVEECSIAERMSWAAERQTTRKEDIAYCLLGLFRVNMPLLYGEGARDAFFRLQTAIIGVSDDESIFAWTGVPEQGNGMLAQSPYGFKDSGDVRPSEHAKRDRPTYTITQKGLEIECRVKPILMNTYLVPILCHRIGHEDEPLGIYLCRTVIPGQCQRIRVKDNDLTSIESWLEEEAGVLTLGVRDGIPELLAPHGAMPDLEFVFKPYGRSRMFCPVETATASNMIIAKVNSEVTLRRETAESYAEEEMNVTGSTEHASNPTDLEDRAPTVRRTSGRLLNIVRRNVLAFVDWHNNFPANGLPAKRVILDDFRSGWRIDTDWARGFVGAVQDSTSNSSLSL